MRSLLDIAHATHRYRSAAPAEKKNLFKKLIQDRALNQRHYFKRFVQGANTQRPPYLRFTSDAFLVDETLSIESAFHAGLLKDQEGVYWIVKKFNPHAHEALEPRVPRNSPLYERLACLLAVGRANYADIRFLHPSEVQGNGIIVDDGPLCYLTRVATESNMRPALLPHSSSADSFSALFVANVFMRKWDPHLNNVTYVGDIPVAIDHDMMGPPSTFPHSPEGMSIFNLAFLSFKLIATLPYLQPQHAVDTAARERLKYYFVRENHREAWTIMQDMIHSLGLGAGLIQAEGLKASTLRRSIQAFKKLGPLHYLAEQAGFQGREKESIIRYLEQSQKTLGRDVGDLWRRISGENARLSELDLV